MDYDDNNDDDSVGFKLTDNDDEVFDDDFDETLEPADEETGFKFPEEEEAETI